MVAEDDVGGPLHGQHVAAVLRRYFIDVRDVWAFRDQLLNEGYWELLDTPEGATTPKKRLTTRGRTLGATVPANMTLGNFHQELQLPIPGAHKAGNSPGKSAVTPGGVRDGQKAIHRAKCNIALDLAMADYHAFELEVTVVPPDLATRVFQKHYSGNKSAWISGRKKAQNHGWMTCSHHYHGAIWSTTPAYLAQLEKTSIKPTLTPDEINQWLIDAGLRQPKVITKLELEPKPLVVIKVPFSQCVAYHAFLRLLEMLVADHNWPAPNRLPLQLLRDTLFAINPETNKVLSDRLTKMKENSLISFLGCVGRVTTVWRINDVMVKPSSQRGARPKLTDSDLQLVIGEVLYRQGRADYLREFVTKRWLGQH